jgi:phosphopantothenoylcysteine decarboxylase
MVTATALALPLPLPKLIAPAMNTKMYDNPLTQRNLQVLRELGYQDIEPKTSLLACGDLGKGALAAIDLIVERIEETLNEQK